MATSQESMQEMMAVQQMEAEEMQETPISMSDSEIVAVLNEELSRGVNGIANEQSTEISQALDYYFARLPGISARKAKDPNASRYVSTDVMDAIEATMAEIMPMFADEQLALFNPSGQQDVEQAELESSLVNYLFINEYNGYIVLQEIIKDALLNRNCTVKVQWDERVNVEYEEYQNVPAMGLQQILQPRQPQQTVEVVEQYVDGQQQVQPQNEQQAFIQQMGGAPQQEETFSIKVKRSTIIGKPELTSVAPEGCIVSRDLRTPITCDARFIAHDMVQPVSSLISQGFDAEIVKQLPSYSDALENYSRNITYNNDFESADESTRPIQVYDCYINLDVDRDGIAERRHIIIAGNQVLLNDESNDQPMIGGCATMVPHTYQGVSLFDRLKSIQDAKTPLARSIIDGTLLASNPRIGVVTGQVNMDDIITSVTGGIVRAESIGSVFELPNPQVPQSSYQMLDFMDNQRREKGGSAITTANMAQSIAGDSAHAVERTMSAMELSNALIAKTIAETIVRGLFIQLHKIIRENHQTEVTAKIGGKWVSSYPQQWQTRANVTIQVGSSQGERRRKSAVMDKIVMAQAQLAQTGSVLFSEDKLFDAISDGAKLDGIPNPERYFVDVTSPEGQQIKQEKDQRDAEEKNKADMMQAKLIEAQQMLGQAEMIKSQADVQANQVKVQNEQLKAEIQGLKELANASQKNAELEYNYATQAINAAKSNADLKFKYDQMEADNAIKLTELELTAAKDLSQQVEDNKISE